MRDELRFNPRYFVSDEIRCNCHFGVERKPLKKQNFGQNVFFFPIINQGRLNLGGHPKPAIRGHLKTGQ